MPYSVVTAQQACSTEMVLKDGGEPIVQMFTNMFNRCPREGKLPNSWKDASSVIIIHKKATADITNYRPISLLPITYKVFYQVILRRMLRTLDQHQPREQAGFRSGVSTIDHIQVISQLQENADEYKIPLCFAFVDYEKAFDSIEFNPLFESLENQGVEAAYITLLRDLCNGVPALGIRWMSLPAMRPNILSLKHVKWLGKRRLRCKSCATKKSK